MIDGSALLQLFAMIGMAVGAFVIGLVLGFYLSGFGAAVRWFREATEGELQRRANVERVKRQWCETREREGYLEYKDPEMDALGEDGIGIEFSEDDVNELLQRR